MVLTMYIPGLGNVHESEFAAEFEHSMMILMIVIDLLLSSYTGLSLHMTH